MNSQLEANYQKVLAAIPTWEPTQEIKRFGTTAIQSIVDGDSEIPTIGFLDALHIKHRLQLERKWPEGDE